MNKGDAFQRLYMYIARNSSEGHDRCLRLLKDFVSTEKTSESIKARLEIRI